ncbi:MAG: hypothetical protein RIC80_02810 [Cyclobacteriaceae bacterium]
MKQHYLILCTIAIMLSLDVRAQVGINTPTPEETSILDLNTSERGLLIPRMTSQRRMDIINQIGTPAEGLLVYDTDEEMFYFYNPNNGDGNNTNGDQNWEAVNPLKYKDLRNNLQGSEYLRKMETHPSVQNISFFEATPGTATPPRLYIDGQVTIGASNTAPQESRGLYVDEKVQVTDDMDVSGTVTANRFDGFGTVPIGGIIMWSGTTAPSGWAICDGNNSTPNLSGRFIISSGGGFNVGNTGGESNTTLSTNNLPSHTHSVSLSGSTTTNGSHRHGMPADGGSTHSSGANIRREDDESTTLYTNYAGSHNHSVSLSGTTGDAGSGTSFTNLPPYYVLAYIQRKQ